MCNLIGISRLERFGKPKASAMALEDYPFRVEKMGPRGEIGHVVCYTYSVLIARAAFKAAVKQIRTKAFGCATER